MRAKGDDRTVWRYMDFSRFVWMVESKALWMCRADRLGDAWEMALSPYEVARFAALDAEFKTSRAGRSSVVSIVQKVVAGARERTYANCWTGSDIESYAMWRLYCGSTDGVAVRTTLGKLRASIGDKQLLKVKYSLSNRRSQTKTLEPVDLVVRKRRPYAYEREYRIVSVAPVAPEAVRGRNQYHPDELPKRYAVHPLGFSLAWDPEKHLDQVVIHPGADAATQHAISAVIRAFAPALKQKLVKSAMADDPIV